MNTDTMQKIRAARASLIFDQPFFGALALRLKIQEDPGCGTAWVDGRTMGYDPEFVASLTHEETTTIVAHEVMHCAAGHPWREGGRDPAKWNAACDFAINKVLEDAGFRMPKEALLDAKYAGKSAEWIYDRLPSGDSGSGSGGQDPGGMGGVRDAPQAAPGDTPPTQAEWQMAVQQAAVSGKMRGSMPADMDRLVQDAVRRRVDWRSMLRRFVQQASREDYTWSRPNPRYSALGIYLPSLHSPAMGPIVVAIDTSGSVDDVLLSQFQTEVQGIADDLRPARVHVICCDSKVRSHEVFERDDQIQIKASGGGGTDFRPVFEEVAKMDEPPVAVVYLTDLDGVLPEREPDVPVLWASTSKRQAPFGEAIAVE